MENVTFVSLKHGRKTRRGYYTMIGIKRDERSFAVCPCKADRAVYFGIPGAYEDFLQVYAEPWDGDKESLDAAIASATSKLVGTNPHLWVDDYDSRTLEKVRTKEIKAHREYILALLESFKAFNHGKEWKPT